MLDEVVQVSQLTQKFDKTLKPALEAIHFNVPKSKMFGIVGPDGAGKTTLLRLIAGLLLPTEGQIEVAGHDTVHESAFIHQMIGYMPQKFGLYEDLTVLENLNFYADLRNVIPSKKKSVFDHLLNFTNLSPFVDRLAGHLSGGMKQKLGLACALLSTPQLLLLDEPTVGVDPISRRELWKMVNQLLGQGISVLWSTAYLEEAERCDAVLLLNEGKMLYQGIPSELTNRVSNRVYQLSNIQTNRRQLLFDCLKQPNVIDAVIQGQNLRLVVKEAKSPPINITEIEGAADLKITQIPPRFEDAFIDILGGGPHEGSALTEHITPIKLKNSVVIEAKKLSKQFGSFIAVNQVSFQIQQGEIFGLLGPNGAGKSTTFKMLCGLLKPTSGQALIEGLDLQTSSSQARSQLGYMAQKFSLYGDLSVYENLKFFSGIYNLKGSERQEAIDEMIQIFNLGSYLKSSSETLSLGYKQRLALACALMHRPVILFLDEPTSGVDPITRREFWNHMNGLVQKGVTVMVTTHFMDEAEYCDRIGLIYRNRLIKVGTPDELKQAAASSSRPFPTLEDAFIDLIEQNSG